MDKTSEEASSKGKKRQRDQQPTDPQTNQLHHQILSLEDNLSFTDTLVALRMMRAQFPRIDKVSIQPFILRSQLYSSVKDRTQVDRELESLRREKVVRIFKLNTGQDDHAIMFLDDYLNQYTLLSLGGMVKDGHISLLINAGLLILKSVVLWSFSVLASYTRQLIDPNMYWFAIPNIGSVLKGLSQGRKEVLSFLNRRRYKEMMLASMEKKRLRFSPLDMRFHLRDLIGSGHLKTVQTSTGLLVRVSKD
ncbi:uncharacterized protein LOC126698486 isoform X5 [Quercus robur]|uniref:uncharacterized protein LOC126698486 isoform X5 n=1 Tax=Quercus robur TaxID=38942 RepID=UPI0021630A73|nr:uncharacterized protein LOC126698486 isoform X5 [Quercus robur]